MLSFVINAMTGLIAAATFALLFHSLRALVPAFSELRAELALIQAGEALRVTTHATGSHPFTGHPAGMAMPQSLPQSGPMPPSQNGWNAVA